MKACSQLQLYKVVFGWYLLLLAVTPCTLLAQEYEESMNLNIELMYKAKNADTLVNVSRVFVELGALTEDNWYPYYYACYSLVRTAFFISDSKQIDKYLDEAQLFLDNLENLSGDKSEVLVLQALLYSMRITNPARGIKYSVLSNSKLDEAQRINSNNPRIYYCRGNNMFYTPAFFGGGKEKALKQFKIAERLYLSAKSLHKLSPVWDFKHNQEMIKKCL